MESGSVHPSGFSDDRARRPRVLLRAFLCIAYTLGLSCWIWSVHKPIQIDLVRNFQALVITKELQLAWCLGHMSNVWMSWARGTVMNVYLRLCLSLLGSGRAPDVKLWHT